MCKYLSGVSGPVRVAYMYVCDRDAALTRATYIRARSRLRAEAVVCIGEPCEYMHKNVCFRVSAPSSRHIFPRAPCSTSSRTLLHLPCLYTEPTYRDDDDVVAAPRRAARKCLRIRNVPARMLTFPARRGMITLTTYICARYCNHVSAPPFYPCARGSQCGYSSVKELCRFRSRASLPACRIAIRVTSRRGIVCQCQ